MNFSASMQEAGPLYPKPGHRLLLKNTTFIQLMRTSFILSIVFLCLLQMIYANTGRAQSISEKITIGLKNETLQQALGKIESKTSIRFFYRKVDIKHITGLNLLSQPRTIEQTLTELLRETELSFRQLDGNVIIEKIKHKNYEIKGRIIGIDRRPIPGASVSIYMSDAKDIIQSTKTDSSGIFKLELLQKGKYIIAVAARGMDSLSISLTLSEKSSIELEEIILSITGNNLADVVIVGRKSYIEEKIDRTVLNVGALISNDGINALEVLEKSPGVLVDASGNIHYKGKSGVMVLIDGKQTYLSGSNLAGYLKSLPSSTLDQIELMDNPPARYDAGGNSGVINIKTKKLKTEGFNGSIAASFSQAHYSQNNESLNLNYRRGKINLFSNLSYSLNQSFRKLELDRHYYNEEGSLKSIFEQVQYIKPSSNAYNAKIGLDYYRSSVTTWGVVFTGLYTSNITGNPSINHLFDSQAMPSSSIISDNNSKGNFKNNGINLNYSHQFDSLGKTITFDIDYLKYNSKTNQSFLNQSISSSGTSISTKNIISNLPTNISIYSVKTDYTQPITGKAKLEGGVKSSYVNTDNAANYFNINNGASEVDYNLSNQFLYRENINSAYLNFNKSLKRFAFQAGLRVENTNASGHQLGNLIKADSAFNNHYTNFFPTAYLSYKLDSAGSNQLILSYGKRIGRPYYQDLNPFIILSDPFTYSSGNPYLKPQFSNNYKLSYNFKSVFSASLYYFYIHDLQNEVIRQQGNIFIDATGNIGKATYFGASANTNLSLTKWWFFSAYLQIFNNRFKGDLFGNALDQSSTFGEMNMTNQFTFPNGWSVEVSGWGITRRAGGQFINFATGQLNAGLQKKAFNNKAAIKLSVRDLLNTYTADGITNFIPNANSTFKNRFYQQTFTLGFNYNFGGINNTKKRAVGSADIEKGRIKAQ